MIKLRRGAGLSQWVSRFGWKTRCAGWRQGKNRALRCSGTVYDERLRSAVARTARCFRRTNEMCRSAVARDLRRASGTESGVPGELAVRQKVSEIKDNPRGRRFLLADDRRGRSAFAKEAGFSTPSLSAGLQTRPPYGGYRSAFKIGCG
jgi:hypothetical protein